MRVKITAAKAGIICRGPSRWLVRNRTNGAPIFLEVGNYPETGEPVPVATEATGYEIPKGTSVGSPLEIGLGPEESLTGIVKTGEGEQELELLRVSPHF